MNPEQQLDPSVVALAKAIGQTESGGNYNAPQGKNGETGAYQMTPGFIRQYAPKVLGQQYTGAPLSPADQDKLAYGVIHQWGTQDKLTPAQIASKWNSGDPSAYLDPEAKGTNVAGAQFDVPGYVNKVQQSYEKNNPTATPEPTQSSPSFLDRWWRDFSGGISQGTSLAGGILGSIAQSPVAKVGLPILAASEGGPIAGAAVSAGLSAIGGGETPQAPQPTPQPTTQQPDVLQEINALNAELPQAHQASQNLANAYQEALGTTISNRNMLKDPILQKGIEVNSKYGFAPNIDENGAMDFSQASKNSLDTESSLHKNTMKVLDAEGTTVPIQSLLDQLVPEIENRRVPIDQQMDVYNDAKKLAETYAQRYPDGQIPLSYLQRVKQEQGYAFEKADTTTKTMARRVLSASARNTILQNTKNPELYNQIMKEEQGLINGRKIMKRLEGRRAPRNMGTTKQLLHSAGKYAALYIGDKIGGPIGAILGSMVGEHITRAVDKKFGKTTFETKGMKQALDILHDSAPAIYNRLLDELKKADVNIQPKEIVNPKGKSLQELLKEQGEPIGKLDVLVNLAQSSKGKQGLIPLKGKQAKKSLR